MGEPSFSLECLDLDATAEIERITTTLRRQVARDLKRRGVVVGVSGGVDSAVCLALAATTFGPERVHALLMPEADADDGGGVRARELCDAFGVGYEVEDIGPGLTALGCYRRRDDAIRRVFPGYGEGWRQKIGLALDILESDRVSYFTLTVESPDGERMTERMPTSVYLEVVAATNMKQRTRKMVEYTHAESLNYAVIGTPNRLEYALGFFVRGGDGLADVKPIAHLYKTQVYALGAALGVTPSILSQTPSTGTYSLEQTQEEFYYALPHEEMDRLLWAHERGVDADSAGVVMGLTAEQVERVYRDIVAKGRVAERLAQDALVVEKVGPGAG